MKDNYYQFSVFGCNRFTVYSMTLILTEMHIDKIKIHYQEGIK